jgi:hypothetical protein
MDKMVDLVNNSHRSLARWRNHFSQLLSAHGANEFWQTEMYTAEPLVPEQNVFEVEMAAEKLKRYKSPGIDQTPAQLITARGGTVHSEIHNLVHSVWNKEEFPTRWKVSINVPIHKKGNKTDCSN